MDIVRKIMLVVGVLDIVAVLLTIAVSNQWWMRALDYPHLQITFVTGLVFVVSSLVLDRQESWVKLYLIILALAWVYQIYILIFYTPLVAHQVPEQDSVDPARSFSLLTANVRMENRDAEAFLDLVAQYSPDVVLVLEPDEWWMAQLRPLREQYQHYIEQPQTNYYGIGLYSRLPLQNPEINFFEQEDVPSIRAILELESGAEVLFYGIHPRPPLPSNSVVAADKELIKIANMTQEAQLPTVIAGDFNDVPWSFTMSKFQEIGQLRDVRVGRGLYNTFPARYPLIRFPLDHVFVSSGLGLAEFAKPLPFSSDHLALYVRLTVDDSGT